jgi:hypothetical protein
MFKNVAAKFMVFAFDSTTNLPKTGDAANITAYVSKDYGAVTVLADTSATEMESTNGKGYYLFDAAQGETNADCLMVSAKSTTANIVVVGAPAVIYTRPTTGWLAPTVAARTLDVSAGGEAGLDWANIGSPTTTVALTGTTFNVQVKKNQALAGFTFLMTDSTNHNPTTGKTVSVTRSINGAAFGAGTLSAVTEVSSGIYSVDFGAGDLNGNVITLRATATGADDLFVTLLPTP